MAKSPCLLSASLNELCRGKFFKSDAGAAGDLICPTIGVFKNKANTESPQKRKPIQQILLDNKWNQKQPMITDSKYNRLNIIINREIIEVKEAEIKNKVIQEHAGVDI